MVSSTVFYKLKSETDRKTCLDLGAQFTGPNMNELEKDKKIYAIRPREKFCFIMNQFACGNEIAVGDAVGKFDFRKTSIIKTFLNLVKDKSFGYLLENPIV